ncbi:MAG: hypothetical protein PUH04_09040 [Firmicutes bacterium]|nr:hypothetical protein [Blautia sp.]MDD7371747.1 hypothetical protein [Bacillota bacterium]MDY3714409.1 hypothetical protein [Blautia sp.]
MSQEKVDKYKKEKRNREKLQKREDRIMLGEKLGIAAVCILLAGWIGYSAYQLLTQPDENAQAVTTEMNVTSITDYLSSLNEAETE